MSDVNPLTLTTSPRLTTALQGDGPAFEQALLDAGQVKAEQWLWNRIGDEVERDILNDALAAWFNAPSPEDRVMNRVDLAEIVSEVDDEVSELLWEASLRDGYARDDSDQAFDAVSHLARIAESTADALTAAEYYIEFLNWRRGDDHVSDPESVHEAFEELARLAELDGETAAAARYAHAHSVFTRVADHDEPGASIGEWALDSPPFTGWE